MLAIVLFCLSLFAQQSDEGLRRLESAAKKYQDIGSYEASAIASRSLGQRMEARIRLELAYASSRLTPPDMPIPMLPPVVRMGFVQAVDAEGKPLKLNRSFSGPGAHFAFDQVAWRVTSARYVGTEQLSSGGNPRKCDVIEAAYEPTGIKTSDPVRYWIESASNTIWKMQFSEPDALSKDREIIRWTVTFDKWIENQPPPQWLIDISTKLAGQESSRLIGYAAPEITGITTTGLPFQLSKLKGKVVLLDFWATWCGPCSEEMASLERLRNALPQKDVEIWSVTEDKPELAKRWLAERKRTLPSVFVEPGAAFKQYGVESLPAIVIIDLNGKVARHWIGLRTEKEVGEAVRKIMSGVPAGGSPGQILPER